MADALNQFIEQRFPRLLAMGVDYNDAKAICGRLKGLEHWPREWEIVGDLHEKLGDEALREGNTVTAGEAFARAAAYYQAAQLALFTRDEKCRLLVRRQSVSQKGLPYLVPPGQPIEIPFEGITFIGNLRLPPHQTRAAPCVLLNPGADSTKEEFYTLENEFLKRGLATFAFDGPGQGLTWWKMKMRPDYEKPVSAIVDVLTRLAEIDGSRIGIWGVSSGGYYAPRAACYEHRLRACISIGGYYDLSENWERFPVSVKDSCQFMLDVDSHEAAFQEAKMYTLAGILKYMKCPLLIVHSALDEVCYVEDAERMNREAGGPTTLVIFPEGTHVCHNIPYKARPLMTDWMAHQLAAC